MPMTIEVYSDRSGKSRWRLKSPSGQTVASAGAAFANRSNAKRAAQAFKANAEKNTFEVYADRSGKPAGGRRRATGRPSRAEARPSRRASARRAATNVQKKVKDADVS